MDQLWREKYGEGGTPAMEPDITDREEKAGHIASNTMDEKGDWNPFEQSPFKGVVMKTQGSSKTLVHWMLEHYTSKGNCTI